MSWPTTRTYPRTLAQAFPQDHAQAALDECREALNEQEVEA